VNGLFLLVLGAEKPVLHKYWCSAWRWFLTVRRWLQNSRELKRVVPGDKGCLARRYLWKQ